MERLIEPIPEPFLLSMWQIQVALLGKKIDAPKDTMPANVNRFSAAGRAQRKAMQARNHDIVIEALYGRQLRISEIARETGLSKSTVQNHLTALAEVGRAEVIIPGRSPVWRLTVANQSSPSPRVSGMVGTNLAGWIPARKGKRC